MKNFIKNNLVLIIGLALPVLLIVIFFAATVIPKALGTPPQYEMLFSSSRYEYQNQPVVNYEFFVKDGKLKARITAKDDKNRNYQTKRLMAYDGKTESVREIAVDISRINEAADGSEIIIEETKNLTIDNSSTSPDGYAFDGPHYGGGGLVMGMFGGGYHNQGYYIKKGNIGYKIPVTNSDYYNLRFIGWVVEKK